MNKRYPVLFCIALIALLVLLLPEPALAGPGGKIASAAFRSFWGRVVLGLLVVIFLPFFLYFVGREYLAVRSTLRDLKGLAAVSDEFDWQALRERIADAFHRVHAAWRREDMQQASEWMTAWYWQNQQLTYLDQWESDGLVNHCRVRKIKKIKPLYVRCREGGGGVDGSRLVVSIVANMEDYLAEKRSGKIVEGKKGYADVETVWTFVHERGRWVVSNIEEDAMWLYYAKLANEIPVDAVEKQKAEAL